MGISVNQSRRKNTFSAIVIKWKARKKLPFSDMFEMPSDIFYSRMSYELLNGNSREKYLKLSKYAYGQKRLNEDEMTIFFPQYHIFVFKI